MPFGGYKHSGYGREKGIESLHHYTQLKTVAVKLTLPDFGAFPLARRRRPFDAFQVGQELVHHWGRTVTDGDNALFSTATCNWNPMHLNVEFRAFTDIRPWWSTRCWCCRWPLDYQSKTSRIRWRISRHRQLFISSPDVSRRHDDS